MKKYLIIGGIIILAVIIAVILVYSPKDEPVGQVVSYKFASDVFGTRIGTSSAPAGFYNSPSSNGTSSKILKLGGQIDKAVFTVKSFNASSSAYANFQFLGSNDDYCDVSTSTAYNTDEVVMGDINWFDIGLHIKDLAGSTTLSLGTTTIIWTHKDTQTKDITLLDLNYQCLQVLANGSSTKFLMQIRTK